MESDTKLQGLSEINSDGNTISTYATAFWKGFYLDLLYAHSFLDSETDRNTFIGADALESLEVEQFNGKLTVFTVNYYDKLRMEAKKASLTLEGLYSHVSSSTETLSCSLVSSDSEKSYLFLSFSA